MNGCKHLRKQMGRVIFRNKTEHLVEICLDCGANARGAGKWVKRSEIEKPVTEVPVIKNYAERVEHQRGQKELFE